MTPARNARLLLALGKAKAEGSREVSLARFNAALLQVMEGSPQVIFILDASGATDQCEDELRSAAESLAACISRNTTGASWSVIAYSPVRVVQEMTTELPSLRASLAKCKGGKAQTAQTAMAFREAKKLMKSDHQLKGDRDAPLVFHFALAPDHSKDTQKALKVLDALQVTVLGLGVGSVKVDSLMKISSAGLTFKVEADELESFVEDACEEVENILKASRTQDPEQILRLLDSG